jgi:2,4-dienoyl-CoA reductase-like NADH-dependent reductase (Old Yellow Enzyme family)
MNPRYPKLLSPIRLGNVQLRNRVVMTGHTTGMAVAGEGIGDQLLAYYEARAQGGVAMIVTEAGSIHPTASHMSRVLRLDDPAVVSGLRRAVERLSAHGCHLVAQLWHSGNNTEGLATDREIWGASAVAGVLNREIPHAVTTAEIRELVSGYTLAARNVRLSGASGVEIHMGHGYLPQQFMSPLTNKRTDEYGGDLERRLRFPIEVLRAVREEVGEQLIVGVRISADEGALGGLSVAENTVIAERLTSTARIDYLSVSFGNYHNMELQVAPMGTPAGHLAHLAEAIRARVDVPVLAVGRMLTPEVAERVLQDGQADLIGMARPLIADPNWVLKTEAGESIRMCVGCNYCQSRLWFGRHVSCIHNPSSGREEALGVPTTATFTRSIAVIGGGPAGLETARVAAERGHQVTLYEATEELGGQVLLAALPASRKEIRGVIDFLIGEVKRLGVQLRLGSEIKGTEGELAQYDAVVVCTGSDAGVTGFDPAAPHSSALDGLAEADTWTGRQAMAEPGRLGPKVVVIDYEGHVQGLSVCEHLLDAGKEVDLITSEPFAASKVGGMAWVRLRQDVAQKGLRVWPSSRVNRVSRDEAEIQDLLSGTIRAIPADSIVFVGLSVARDSVLATLTQRRQAVLAAGDCVAPRHLDMAILEGARVGRLV